MHAADLDYQLSTDLIAQTPVEPRDASRLLVADRAQGAFEHRRFHDVVDLLAPGDLLVANDTHVINARIAGRKPSGGRAEILLLRRLDALRWEALVGGRRVTSIEVNAELHAQVEPADTTQPGATSRIVAFNQPVEPFLATIGEAPLPPYIHERLDDPARYQTVYHGWQGRPPRRRPGCTSRRRCCSGCRPKASAWRL